MGPGSPAVSRRLSCGSGGVMKLARGKPYTAIGQVPWESLNAGDTVLIHWRSNAYQEKWVICRQGSPNAPITVRGVPGPSGQLPVIDGNGATTRPQLNFWNQERAVVKIGGASVPPDTTPGHIVIEDLDIRSARPPFTYRTPTGATASYIANAAAHLRRERHEHHHPRLRACSDCGNGLFIAAATRNVLIEGNYILGNGNEGSAYEHNSYTAAEQNHLPVQPLRPAAHQLPGQRAQGPFRGPGGALQLDRRRQPAIGPRRRRGQRRIAAKPALPRHAHLWQRARRAKRLGQQPDRPLRRRQRQHRRLSQGHALFLPQHVVSSRSGNTTLFRLSTNDESCDARNNLFFVTASGNRLALLDGAGRLFLTHNWFKPGYVNSHSTLTGSITNDGSNVTGSDPGFLSLARQEFRLNTNSACINAGTNLHPAVLPLHPPVWHYRKAPAIRSAHEPPRSRSRARSSFLPSRPGRMRPSARTRTTPRWRRKRRTRMATAFRTWTNTPF